MQVAWPPRKKLLLLSIVTFAIIFGLAVFPDIAGGFVFSWLGVWVAEKLIALSCSMMCNYNPQK
jgi:hypothetical protein